MNRKKMIEDILKELHIDATEDEIIDMCVRNSWNKIVGNRIDLLGGLFR